MELKEILSISGKPGLYKMVANRSNGLIVTPIGKDEKTFMSSRQHMFTPIENITIYTDDESEELVEVFTKMKKSKEPLVDHKANGKVLREFFTKIVPNHDTEKVYTSDIKKIIKWFKQLDEHKLIKLEEKKPKTEKKTKTKKTTKKKATEKE